MLTDLCNIQEFFAVNTKLGELVILVSKDFTAAKNVTSSGARPVDHWISRLSLFQEFNTEPTELVWHNRVSLRL